MVEQHTVSDHAERKRARLMVPQVGDSQRRLQHPLILQGLLELARDASQFVAALKLRIVRVTDPPCRRRCEIAVPAHLDSVPLLMRHRINELVQDGRGCFGADLDAAAARLGGRLCKTHTAGASLLSDKVHEHPHPTHEDRLRQSELQYPCRSSVKIKPAYMSGSELPHSPWVLSSRSGNSDGNHPNGVL